MAMLKFGRHSTMKCSSPIWVHLACYYGDRSSADGEMTMWSLVQRSITARGVETNTMPQRHGTTANGLIIQERLVGFNIMH